ncbi:hypothetical protein ACFVJ5_31010 [Nocardia sp. NPDC127606]|uniref:hypothetical protein n=1 Tax=Nocardia sp. NPDC127606 TaxID=3345406 RepID=UPI0036376CA1
MSANSTPGNPLPTIKRTQTGVYTVSIPGLGTRNPGIAQVTALGSGTTHCIAFPPVASSTDPSTLIVFVHGWAGSTRADTDFILNYDLYMTRISTSHQGARAHANTNIYQSPPIASYTPSRSYNTGSIFDAPGTNTAFRISKGRYRMHHSEIGMRPNSVWVGAAPAYALSGNYCKLERWVPSTSRGTDVYIRCYDAQGNLAESPYYETYQGAGIGPS